MKIVLVAINAKYIHTNLAVRSIACAARAQGVHPHLAEFTVNQSPSLILRALYGLGADCYLFSCYLWNVHLVCRLADELKKVSPGCRIGVGGPEILYRGEDFLSQNPAVDFAVICEGETCIADLATALEHGDPLEGCAGLVVRDCAGPPPGVPMRTAHRPRANLDSLPFPYSIRDHWADGQILYYESSRGCPYSCAYCLSSVEKGVRLRSLPLVLQDLGIFLNRRVRQVKFVDRTFNCDPGRALSIWRFLKEADNGVTNFHFELAGELLDDSAVEFLSTVRPGLFQFEIGVQSANAQTLKAINRPSRLESLFSRVKALREPDNIHIHLDLIAGLPYEDLNSFANSFNQVYRLAPHQLQLGFLKVLSGSAVEQNAPAWELRYQSVPPYQVLCNRWLSFEQLAGLEGIAQMVELYYNSGRFSHCLQHICGHFPTPFCCYREMWRLYEVLGYPQAPPDKVGQYEFLGRFAAESGIALDERLQWLCKFDVLLHERPRRLPDWLGTDLSQDHRELIRAFYRRRETIAHWLPDYINLEPKAIGRLTHLEYFPFDPVTGEQSPVYILFEYRRRTLIGRATTVRFHAIDPSGRPVPAE